MLKKLFAAIGVGSLIALGAAVPAHAAATVTLTADPSTVVVGEESTLTATGLLMLSSSPRSSGTPRATLGRARRDGENARRSQRKR